MNGKDRVLKYMQDFGSITTLDAIKDLGDTRLSDKIYRLKREGYVIKTQREQGKNRYGEKTQFVRYSLGVWYESRRYINV